MDKETKKCRRTFRAEDKIEILRKHIQRAKAVDTCEEYRLNPVMLSQWIKTLLESGKDAFSGNGKKRDRDRDKQIERYEEELRKKNEVIAILSEELLKVKKKPGEL